MSTSNNNSTPPQHVTVDMTAGDNPPTSCLSLHNILRLKPDPEPVLLTIMKPMKPFPLHQAMDFSKPIKWYFFLPRWDFRLLLSLLACLMLFSATFLFLTLKTAAIIFGVLFSLIGALIIKLRVNIATNQSLRATACKAMAKAEQAKQIYDSGAVPEYLTKENFAVLKAFLGPTFVVLRDGTVEDNRAENNIEKQNQMQGFLEGQSQGN